jgi:hypothetical protein
MDRAGPGLAAGAAVARRRGTRLGARGPGSDRLVPGTRLAAAQAALADRSADLVAVEAEFLEASIGRESAESRARHRRTLVLRGLSLALVLLLVGGVGVVVSAVQAQRNSARLTRDTASQGLAALSIDGLNSSGVPYDADVRALAAWRAARTSEALGALLSARMSGYAGRLPDTGTDRVEALAATSDGRLVAASTYCQSPVRGNACALRIWDARSRKLLIDQPYQGIVVGQRRPVRRRGRHTRRPYRDHR